MLNMLSLFFSSNTLHSQSVLIQTFTPWSYLAQEQEPVWCIFSATCFAQGPSSFTFSTLTPPKPAAGFSIQMSNSNISFEYKLGFLLDFCVCTFAQTWSSPTFQAWSWKCYPCQSGRALSLVPAFDWPPGSKPRNLSALNLTGGILFLEWHKLAWEWPREKDFMKGFERLSSPVKETGIKSH